MDRRDRRKYAGRSRPFQGSLAFQWKGARGVLPTMTMTIYLETDTSKDIEPQNITELFYIYI